MELNVEGPALDAENRLYICRERINEYTEILKAYPDVEVQLKGMIEGLRLAKKNINCAVDEIKKNFVTEETTDRVRVLDVSIETMDSLILILENYLDKIVRRKSSLNWEISSLQAEADRLQQFIYTCYNKLL